MKSLLCLLLLPLSMLAQDAEERSLVALTITYNPDKVDSGRYYLIAEKPAGISLKEHQTFLLQSSWQAEGDSIVNLGAGTINLINDKDVELNAILYPGKKVRKGDMAMFLVPLPKPGKDSLFFKMARLNIMFKSIQDSNFDDRDVMLTNPSSYPGMKLLSAMAADVRYTGKAMSDQGNDQDQLITKGLYKGQKLFELMQKVKATDLILFIGYVYARPDKYKSHEWKVSETFATWLIAGAPTAK